jgi:tetratricopeptide (TPR) repeat protein
MIGKPAKVVFEIAALSAALAVWAPKLAFAQEDDPSDQIANDAALDDSGAEKTPSKKAQPAKKAEDASPTEPEPDKKAPAQPAKAATKALASPTKDPRARPPKDAPRQPGAEGQSPPPVSAIAQLEGTHPINVITETALKDALEARAKFLRAGDQTNADAELLAMLDARTQLGARNVVLASAALIHEATQAASAGRIDHAIDLAETASKLSPDLTEAHWLRTRLYWSRNWLQVDRIFGSFADLSKAKLLRFRNLVVFVSNVIGVLCAAIFFTIIAFSVIQLVKYLRYVAHDFSRVLPSWFGPGEGAMVLLIAIASPLVFGFGVAPSLVLALGAAFAYQTVQERTISKAALVALAIAPGLMYVAAPLVTFHGSIVDAMETASTEAFAIDAERVLTEYSKSGGRNDLHGALVLARRYRMRGDLAKAEVEYRRALAAQPDDVVARNNLGTLLYLLGHEEQARATFQQAMSGNTTYAEPFLNTASILLDSSNFDEANIAIEKARRIDRELTDRYTKIEGTVPTAKKLLDADLSDAPLWLRLLDVDATQRNQVTSELWKLIGGRTPPLMMPALALLVFALALALSKRAEDMGLTIACPKCGTPAMRDAPAQYCEQCQSIFLKAVAVEPVLRLEKENQVSSHQRRRRLLERVLSLLAGAGNVFADRALIGTTMMFGFFVCLASMLWTEGLIVHPWTMGREASSSMLQLVTCGIAGVALAGLSVRQAFK